MYAHTQSDRYRELATAILGLIPTMEYPEAVRDLSRLAARYERLARYFEDAVIPSVPNERAGAGG